MESTMFLNALSLALTGTIVTLAVGAIVYVAKSIYTVARAYLTTTVHVRYTSPKYTALRKFCLNSQAHKAMTDVSIEVDEESERDRARGMTNVYGLGKSEHSSKTPVYFRAYYANTVTWCWFENRPIRVSLFADLTERITSDRGFSTNVTTKGDIALQSFGDSKSLIERFIRSIEETHDKNNNGRVIVMTPDLSYSSKVYWEAPPSQPGRPLENVFVTGDVMRELVADFEEFLRSRDYYASLSVPYRRGYLFYGPPGTGKTTAVQALASRFSLAVCSIPLSAMSSGTKLQETMQAAPSPSILLIEDIDTTLKLVCKSTAAKSGDDDDDTESSDSKARASKSQSGSSLTLSDVLNAFDGVSSHTGNVVIITTNHPEKLDETLLRPGRISRQVEFKLADEAVARRMFECFYAETSSRTNDRDTFARHIGLACNVSQAAIQEFLLSRRGQPTRASSEVSSYFVSSSSKTKAE